MRSNGVLAALVGFLTCAVIVLGVALAWSVREQNRIQNSLSALEERFYKADSEWSSIRTLSLSALQLEQQASETRSSITEEVDGKIARLRKETQEPLQTFSRDVLFYKMDQGKKWERLDQKLGMLAKHLKANGVEWVYFPGASLGEESR